MSHLHVWLRHASRHFFHCFISSIFVKKWSEACHQVYHCVVCTPFFSKFGFNLKLRKFYLQAKNSCTVKTVILHRCKQKYNTAIFCANPKVE